MCQRCALPHTFMFSFFKKKPPQPDAAIPSPDTTPAAAAGVAAEPLPAAPPQAEAAPVALIVEAVESAPVAIVEVPEVQTVPMPAVDAVAEVPAADRAQVAAAAAEAAVDNAHVPASAAAHAAESTDAGATATDTTIAPVAAWSQSPAAPAVMPDAVPASPHPAPSSRRYGTTSTFVAPTMPAAAAASAPPVAAAETEAVQEAAQEAVQEAAPPTSTPIAAEPAPELIPETMARPVSEAQAKQSWMERLKRGLSKTSSSLSLLFVGARIDEDLYDELESALLMADAGVEATSYLLDALKKRVKEDKLLEASAVKAALKQLMTQLMLPLQKPFELGRHEPLVMMIAGVNGAGKTTTIGKLAKHMQAHQQSVLLAAGDTFRAAAREQLMVWGQRNNVTVISQESGDPAAVAYDAVQSGKARKMDVVMVDTAGRLPTQLHLMEELKKIKRVIGKGMDGAPHETVLVIDGNTGQNALAQVKAFDDALQLTGLIITKLDGTAKGGVLAAIARTRPVPVYFIGVGEKIEDLQPFKADEFVEALLG
jgi:fused signal recognition particle receptor